MATVPTLPLVSVEEYLRSSYKPECEYVEGVLEPKGLPSAAHSLLHLFLTRYLYSLEKSHDFLPLTELRIPISPRRYRVPDIALLPTAWLNDHSLIPLATIEILSPDDRISRVVATVRDQHSLGVRNILVADPHERVLFVADSHGLLQGVTPAQVTLDLPDRPSLTIDFAELFAQVPQE